MPNPLRLCDFCGDGIDHDYEAPELKNIINLKTKKALDLCLNCIKKGNGYCESHRKPYTRRYESSTNLSRRLFVCQQCESNTQILLERLTPENLNFLSLMAKDRGLDIDPYPLSALVVYFVRRSQKRNASDNLFIKGLLHYQNKGSSLRNYLTEFYSDLLFGSGG